jgi:hypothetical protein
VVELQVGAASSMAAEASGEARESARWCTCAASAAVVSSRGGTPACVRAWNVHGLNSCARRSVVWNVVLSERMSLFCLQETKVHNDSLVILVAWCAWKAEALGRDTHRRDRGGGRSLVVCGFLTTRCALGWNDRLSTGLLLSCFYLPCNFTSSRVLAVLPCSSYTMIGLNVPLAY